MSKRTTPAQNTTTDHMHHGTMGAGENNTDGGGSPSFTDAE